MPHRFSLRVYYEDTDLAGIVYYANYLKFIERARSEWVRELGVDQVEMKDQQGMVFAVSRVEADYKSPARFDDVLCVETKLERVTAARIVLHQCVLREDKVLFDSLITLVCISNDGMPLRIPADIRQMMQS
ncbi:MAG: tol-pal system-associated acyl-CoA thioesterase [Litoreibacter sp.]